VAVEPGVGVGEGTVKRTKQKLEESTSLKKRCQEDSQELLLEAVDAGQKRCPSLYRSASSAHSPRQRQPIRCNSEELMHTSDIENKNTTPGDQEATVVLRVQGQTLAEDQRISGNVQILKQNFEAKAGVVGAGGGGGVAAGTGSSSTISATGSGVAGANSANTVKKTTSHQSLPSSPVAQHANHVSTASNSNSSASNSSDSSVSENCDRNVKGLVHKYQTTTSCSSQAAAAPTVACAPLPPAGAVSNISHACSTTTTTTSFKQRPLSYYDRSLSNRSTHDYSDSRPPPAPIRTSHSSNTQHHQQQQQQPEQQQVQIRRLAQHGKTHPLSRLSAPKTGFNTAAYNTM